VISGLTGSRPVGRFARPAGEADDRNAVEAD
jgi:hypothetical protein